MRRPYVSAGTQQIEHKNHFFLKRSGLPGPQQRISRSPADFLPLFRRRFFLNPGSPEIGGTPPPRPARCGVTGPGRSFFPIFPSVWEWHAVNTSPAGLRRRSPTFSDFRSPTYKEREQKSIASRSMPVILVRKVQFLADSFRPRPSRTIPTISSNPSVKHA